MARIRTIKPEFWSDEKMSPLPAIVRLVFLGLISMADDAGRIVDNVKSIDGFIFPESTESSRESLDNLASIGRILRYTSGSGQHLIQVANWLRHQKVDKPAKYVLPAPDEPSRDPRENVARSSRSDLRPTTNDQLPTTSDQRPPTAAAAEASRDYFEEAKRELLHVLRECPDATEHVETFVAGLPSAVRQLAWCRSLLVLMQPITGGRTVAPRVLVNALADFNLADRTESPYKGVVFRAFVDRAENESQRPLPTVAGMTSVGSVLEQWARTTDAKERASTNA